MNQLYLTDKLYLAGFCAPWSTEMSMQHWIVRNGVQKIKAILFLFLQGVPLKPQKKKKKILWQECRTLLKVQRVRTEKAFTVVEKIHCCDEVHHIENSLTQIPHALLNGIAAPQRLAPNSQGRCCCRKRQGLLEQCDPPGPTKANTKQIFIRGFSCCLARQCTHRN